MLSFRLRNVESWDEGLSGVMAFTANGKNLAILPLTVNPKWNIVVRKDFFRIKHHKTLLLK